VLNFATAVEWLTPRLRRRSTWFLGALFAVVGVAATDIAKSYFTAGFEHLVSTVRSTWEERACERREALVKNDDGLFTILLSPLQGDDSKRSRTERVGLAFLGQAGFRLITLCEPFGIDLSVELITSQIQASRRGEAILRERGADLLIFGRVLTDNSLYIWAINDHGGCHFSSDPIILRNGAVPGEFQKETKNKLIGVTLSKIAAACDREPKDIDWQLLERQLLKLGNLLASATLELPEDQLINVSLAFYNGVTRVYANGDGNDWLEKGRLLSRAEATAAATGDLRRAQAWLLYGKFSYMKSTKSGDKKDLEAALNAYNRSIQISPRADAFGFRADAYIKLGEDQHAIEDLDQAIQLNPDDPTLLLDRASVYSKVGKDDRAIRDLDQAIQLKPDDPPLLNWRCYLLAKAGHLGPALSDCNRAIALRPDFAAALDSRGFTYLRLGQLDNAMSDYDAALKLNPKSAESLYGRGLANMKKGQTQKAKEDITAAEAIKPDIAGEFARYGLK
jgi:tetratricopeptide (TPR) repeat protein